MNAPIRSAIAADTIFDGSTTHQNAAVIIAGEQIVGVFPRSDLPSDLDTEVLSAGDWLAPGFIDIQVNGGGDVLFNDAPTPEAIAKLVAAHRRFGTTSLLPTLISDSEDKMQAAYAAVEAMVGVEPSVLGIHLEGPFLSMEKRGVHDANFIREPTPSDADLLCRDRKGVLLVTLAPERVPEGFIRRLNQSDARIALGHSMATYDETRAAMAEGLSGLTHVFNAMRPLASRDPGPIAAILESDQCWFGMIADGFHVHPAMLRLALRGRGHPILVTDAMPPVGGGQTSFPLYGQEIKAVEGRCLRSDGTLSGALLNMATAVRNCVHLLQTSLEEALRFASRNPAEFLGLGHTLGKLAPGYRADMVAFDPKTLSVDAIWVAGSRRSTEG
ncbi:MAG: N-acetylglucosamine-6-phosphate deacetylase [Kiloniellales bacterium]|nr:N-acetylglucosamine-6-phosphate deacetylase [Kiloniellales bacterium]